MKRCLLSVVLLAVAGASGGQQASAAPATLQVGFGEADITPKLGKEPVYMAGFGQNRKATRVHDPLFARAVVLKDGKRKIALASVDLVGFFYANASNVRKQLPGFHYVLVSSTHNHEGPDTLGLWGSSPFKSGIDPAYLKTVEGQIVKAIKQADANAVAASAQIGTAKAPELLHDGREPFVKHDELVALRFEQAGGKGPAGIVVQWNCHPETLSSRNTEISADYVGATVKHLRDKYRCPVVYLTGTVGGLMTSLKVDVKSKDGKALADSTWEKTERYGVLVGELAERALKDALPLRLTPLEVHTREVFIPMDNKLYLLGRQLGVLKRDAYLWRGDPRKAEPADATENKKPLCLKTEVGWLRLGELDVAAIPGEIYPELVLDKVQDPVDPGADFPTAPIEPAIYKQLRGPHRMMIGLANDEIGYIIPKRQWDVKKPFCYGRTKPQYGEQNSVGPEAAPIVCAAFRDLVRGKRPDAGLPRRANVVVILADDLGYGDLSIHGSRDVATPHIDSIARDGVRCTSGYVSAPYCSPSRAGLLTGRYQQRFGHEFNPELLARGGKGQGLAPSEVTIAARLKAAGYATGLLGKWHQGEEDRFHPLNRGFGEFFGFLPGAHPYLRSDDKTWGPIYRGREKVELDGYLTDVLAREAVSFIDRHRKEPFFLYLAFNAVHTPMEVPEAVRKRFDHIKDSKRRIHLAMTAALDEAVGKVLGKLRSAGLEENTLVFFLSDNGGPTTKFAPNASSNGPLRGSKGDTWEGGIRVPFFVRWKGRLAAGTVYNHPVIALDIHATALAAAGIAARPDWKLDGVNLLPFLEGDKSGVPHLALFWRFGEQMAIRTGDWKLVRPDLSPKEFGRIADRPMLFNLRQDVGEKTDLAEKYPERVKDMMGQWQAWNKELKPPAWLHHSLQKPKK